jgi:hypothetical protein
VETETLIFQVRHCLILYQVTSKNLAKRNHISVDMMRSAVGSLSAYPVLSRKKLANDMAKEIDAIWIKKVT